MATAADLEIVLSWREEDELFDLSLAFDDPQDYGDRRLIWQDPVEIDTDRLGLLRTDPARYGEALTGQLFAAEELRDFYRRAKSWAERESVPLRMRLSLDPAAPARMQAVRWETLVDLDGGEPLALRTDVRFSRYLSGAGWDLIRPPRKHDLRALVVVAAPSDLPAIEDATLAPVGVDAEVARAQGALAPIQPELLASRGQATLGRIAAELDHGIDILYLVCHGFFDRDGQPLIVLEDDEGLADPVTPEDFEAQISAREKKPTIAALCACQSAGAGVGAAETGDDGALAPLGPQLAKAGVAAVVAMQHNITMETAGRFLTSFFDELERDGVVDRAVAAARIEIRERLDWWVPVLFSRLKRGRTYYRPGYAADDVSVNLFVSAVKDGDCTPVLGPGLAEPVLGSRTALARKWVERWLLPIPEPDNESLTTVGQYVQTEVPGWGAHKELARYLVHELKRDERYDSIDRDLFEPANRTALLRELGRLARERDPNEPHEVMARLNLPVYITTSWTDLLSDALVAHGRQPQVRSFNWNERFRPEPEIDEPTPERPLVYHLFGQLERPRSMVLTEDDYFQWLAAWADLRHEEAPSDATESLTTRALMRVIDALTTRSLMFVGYRFPDWDFRVLFQGLRNFRGNDWFRQLPHVGVQVDPSAPGVEHEAAQDYLNKYFAVGGLTIYWGKTEEFLSDLSNRISEA